MDASDEMFKLALRLMHSEAENSEEQLRKLLDDAIKKRYDSSRTVTSYLNKKLDKGTGECSGESSAKKTPANDAKKSSSSRHCTTEKLPLTESDLALEEMLLEDDLSCVICRCMDIGVHNQMVECMDCKSLYHQECHQPPVALALNDPKSIWRCANCTAGVNQGASSSSMMKHTSGITPPLSAEMKPTSATKFTSSSFASSSKACESLPQTKPLSSTSSCKSVVAATSSSKLVMPNINILNAEKKIQIMNRKAVKQHEKRKRSK